MTILKAFAKWLLAVEAEVMEDILDTKEAAIRDLHTVARELRGQTISYAIQEQVDQSVRETIAALSKAQTIDLQAKHADYVSRYGASANEAARRSQGNS